MRRRSTTHAAGRVFTEHGVLRVVTSGLAKELREQGRAIVGAFLVVGVTFVMTMETWWLGWQLPAWHLLLYAFAGLALVMVITRSISFRSEEQQTDGQRNDVRRYLTDSAELVLQSFVAAYVSLLMFGLIELGDPFLIVARLGLVLVVPLGFGAALANELLKGGQSSQRSYPKTLAVFALGSVFLSAPIAPTQEMKRMAAHAGWPRHGIVIVVTLLVTYLMLYELELQGQNRRLKGESRLMQWSQPFVVYLIGFAAAFALLAGFGQFTGTTYSVWVQQTVILAFPASIGGSAAQVII